MDGIETADAIAKGIHNIAADISVICVPVADGGDGLVEVLAKALDGKLFHHRVYDPLGNDIDAQYCYLPEKRIGIVEMAKASGLALLPVHARNPEKTTTLGTGKLIEACLDRGAERLIIGLGGSATCDGGIGMAHGMGYRFLDKSGRQLEPIGENLLRISTIDRERVDGRIFDVTVDGVCDVDNPLFGKNGASYVYSPQKGGTPGQVKRLDDGLKNLARVIKSEMGIDVENQPGAGAAGGLGAGIMSFLGGKLVKGIDLVIDIVGLREQLRDAHLVITGEGQIDNQTVFDKAPAGVARAAKQAGVPCVAICGSIGDNLEQLYDIGLDGVFSLCSGPMPLKKAMAEAPQLLERTAEQVVRTFLACTKA